MIKSWKKLAASFIFLLFIQSVHATERLTDIVFVIVLDGTRLENAYGLGHTAPKPFLKSLIEEGVAYQGRANYPSNTLTNFTSIATGSSPGLHGVTAGMAYFDKKTFERIPYTKDLVAVPSVFEALENNGLRGIFISAKGYDATGVGHSKTAVVLDMKKMAKEDPTVVEKAKYDSELEKSRFNEGFPYGWEKDDHIAHTPQEMAFANKIRLTQNLARAGLDKIEEEVKKNDNVAFAILNFHTADLTGHTWGPNHPNYDLAVAEMSRGVDFFVHEIKKRLPNKRMTFIITADHGFKSAGSKRSLNWSEEKSSPILDEFFKDIPYGVGDCGSACVSFYIKNSADQQAAFDRLIAERKKKDGWVEKIYTYLDLPKADGKLRDLKTYNPERSPEFMIDLKRDWTLLHVYGHGSHRSDDMNIPMILSGAGIQKIGKISKQIVPSIDVAPTALRLLGIEAPKEWDGEVVTSAIQSSK